MFTNTKRLLLIITLKIKKILCCMASQKELIPTASKKGGADAPQREKAPLERYKLFTRSRWGYCDMPHSDKGADIPQH